MVYKIIYKSNTPMAKTSMFQFSSASSYYHKKFKRYLLELYLYIAYPRRVVSVFGVSGSVSAVAVVVSSLDSPNNMSSLRTFAPSVAAILAEAPRPRPPRSTFAIRHIFQGEATTYLSTLSQPN